MLQLILAIRSARRAFKQADQVKKALIAADALFLADVTTQAAAYGFEIGTGAPLKETVNVSPNNPFRNPEWRATVEPGGE